MLHPAVEETSGSAGAGLVAEFTAVFGEYNTKQLLRRLVTGLNVGSDPRDGRFQQR